MSFGKLYTRPGNARSSAIRAVAQTNNLDLDVVELPLGEPLPEAVVKLNPLGKIPVFEGADGYVLTECLAIAIYITSQNEKTSLLGKTKQDYASIVRWMSFANHEILPPLGDWFSPLIGRDPYNRKSVDDAQTQTLRALKVLENHLHASTYLVGERLTLADLFVAAVVKRGFEYVLGTTWREENPNVTRWCTTVLHQSIFSTIVPDVTFVQEGLKNVAPAKKDAPPKEKAANKKEPAAPKPKAANDDDDEDEDAVPAAPKPKHPLDLLPKATFVLDDWKRKYSNEETRSVALPWFWENYKADEYTLWAVDYKYNSELTMVFMSSNLIGGFFARLEASRKFIFGAASVYGVANDSIVKGAFVIRGDDARAAFDVAPDYDSYSFTKLDAAKPEDREFVDSMWAWDKPIVVEGKTYEHADGKVFK